MPTNRCRTVLAAALGLACAVSLGAGQAASTQALGGPDRYLTALSTDKPIYRPGEKVYARGVLLHAASRKPLPANEQAQAHVEIKGPKGDTVASGYAPTQDSVWGFAWDIPRGTPGGQYTLKVAYPWNGHAPAERKFDVRAYRAPRLRSQIVFLRDGYGPGEQVTATLHAERSEGGIPEGARVTVTARVDGAALEGAPQRIDARGNCSVRFDLPREIARGEGTLALVIEDGGVVETASKTIPILLQTVDLRFYPEGGDLAMGLPSRVYFEARQPNGKPADLAGEVIESPTGPQARGEIIVAKLRTEHEGRGRFEFTPQAMCRYSVRITQPAGIRKAFPLPEAKEKGAVLRSERDLFGKGEPVAFTVLAGPEYQKLKLTVSRHEKEASASEGPKGWPSKEAGVYSVPLDLPPEADGVLRVTLWDEKGAPLAERLVYREPAKKLRVTISAGKGPYVPGGEATLTVRTTDADGKPVPAVVGLTVTDDAVLEMIEKREQAPRLPVMMLLEPEVKDLADAHVYLDPENPKAPLALDLLLGTQGWRRFAFMDVPRFLREHGDAARRTLALRIEARHEVLRVVGARGDWDGMPRPAGAPPPPAQAPEGRAPQEEAVAQAADKPADRNELQKALEDFDKQAEKKDFLKEKAFKKLQRRQDFVVVREYAHQVRPGRRPTDRADFTETLYWCAGVRTGSQGEASVRFGLSDSVTTFRVSADAFDGQGALGAAALAVESVQPFYAEPKLPLEVTAGDEILLPVNLVNSTGQDLPGATLVARLKGNFKVDEVPGFDLRAFDRARRLLGIRVGHNNGAHELVLLARAGPYEDKVTRKLEVRPEGFPIEVAFGGLLGAGRPASHVVLIPQGVVPASVTTNVAVYPTPLANMTEALARLIQDPCGCFEQTSSTSYPLTMAQQYFLSHTGVEPKLVETARAKLDAGYKRLVSFWCPDRGYEWFGQDPGHEALTAFGVLHFTDMAQVREVDAGMVRDTRAWLLRQRDGQGGFARKRRALHTWIEDKDCSNAYIVWSLLESGEDPKALAAEIAALREAAGKSGNSYVLALGANVMALAGDKAEAARLMGRLAARQNKEGGVDGGTASIVGSEGETLAIETSALAALAWLRDPAYAANVERCMKYLADSCKAGRYGSTQSTVLALRAIVAYDRERARPKAPGRVRVFVDGQGVGEWLPFGPSTQGAIKLPDVSELLGAGEHRIELRMEEGGEMPYAVAVNYHARTPASSKECKLDLEVRLAEGRVAEGASTEANVTVVNRTREALPMPVAIVGLPGGLEPRHDQLKELVKKGAIDAYEVLGREVVLYWRSMAAGARVEVPLSLIAAVPGTYTGPASRAYLYYADEHKRWVEGVRVAVATK